MTLTDDIIKRIRAKAETIEYGRIIIEINATKDCTDIIVEERLRHEKKSAENLTAGK